MDTTDDPLDGTQLREKPKRRTVDHMSAVVRMLEVRVVILHFLKRRKYTACYFPMLVV